MKYTKYPELKNRLKELAQEIKTWKRNRKQDKRRELNIALWKAEYEVFIRRDEFRTKHIAHCLLRGREYDKIEKPSSNNPPNWREIEATVALYEQQALRASS